MKTNKDIMFPYYEGNIFNSKVIGYVKLNEFIKSHKNPKPPIKMLFKLIKEAEDRGDKKRKRTLKQKLFAFTPSVVIDIGQARKYDNVKEWTGIMQMDFDHIPDKETAIELKEHLFNRYNHIICAYLSPSQLGIKCLIRTVVPRNKEHFKALHKSIKMEMEQFSYFDNATNNAMLPLFLSKDEDILYRQYSDCFPWSDENWSEVNYVDLLETKPDFNPQDFVSKESIYDNTTDKTINIFTRKIQNINSEGHTQLRSACLILGSRCGAGYISVHEAHNLAHTLIESNSYLSKGVSGYKKTASWAIDEGIKKPMYYKK